MAAEPSNQVFTFRAQLSIGEVGENLFIDLYSKRKAKKSEVLNYDILLDDKLKIELKTDTYPIKNFFFERFGNTAKQTPGGPWQSIDCDFFVYLFLKDKTFFWFKPTKLVKFLDKFIKTQTPRQINNRTYTSTGYIVPLTAVEHLCEHIDKF
jgi:hypothetical protein